MPTKVFIAAVASIMAASSAGAQETDVPCRELADSLARQATREVLADAVEADPSLKHLSEEELAKKAGRIFLSAERPDFKAYGFIMLLWFGGEEGRGIAAQGAADLETEDDRAHFYFVQGMYQLRASSSELASTGRDYIRQIRDTGKVTFVSDDMWDQLINRCRLPS